MGTTTLARPRQTTQGRPHLGNSLPPTNIFSMATVGVIVPVMLQLSTAIGATMSAVGLAIGIFSLSAALLAFFGGALIDRIGPVRSPIGSIGSISTHSGLFSSENGTVLRIVSTPV